MSEKRGIIKISSELIFNSELKVLGMLFSKAIPYKINYISNGIYEYYCISEEFESIKEWDVIPYYDVIFKTKKENGRYVNSIEIKRI